MGERVGKSEKNTKGIKEGLRKGWNKKERARGKKEMGRKRRKNGSKKGSKLSE